MKKIDILKGILCSLCLVFSNLTFADWTTLDNISVSQSKARYIRGQGIYIVQVDVTNNSSESLTGPFRILIENTSLPVVEHNGVSASGIPYFNVLSTELPANSSTSITAKFEFARGTRLAFDVGLQNDSSNWALVWNDEFNGTSLDLTKWEHEVNCWGGGNGEQQCYTDRADNTQIADGMLNIIAKREDFTGPANKDGSGSTSLPYTSSRLRTMNQGDWKYGRVEVRAKLPFGQGTWPAIWMLPTDYIYGGWAASGEIDIIEAVNLKVADQSGAVESAVHGTLHYGKAWPENVSSGAAYHLPNNESPADDYHVYAIEWEEDEIRWYVDDVHFATQQSSGWYSQYEDDNGNLVNGTNDAPYNQPFHVLLNLAVGGAWAGNANNTGIDESVFPQTLSVDYVRVYECSVSPATGAGCANVSPDAELVSGHQAPEIVDPIASFGELGDLPLYIDSLAEGLNFNSYNPDDAISYQEVEVDGRGTVLAISKTGVNGNVYFEYLPRINMGQWLDYGELVFDIKVDSKNEETKLLVKLDSGWPAVSDYTVTLPESGNWAEIRISVADLLAGGNRFSVGNRAFIDDVLSPFVIEPTNAIELQLDNVRFEYSLAGVDTANIFDGNLKSPFTLSQYNASGNVAIDILPALDSSYGDVLQLDFDTNESVVFFQTKLNVDNQPLQLNVSYFDFVEFDLNVVSDDRELRNFMVKMDCGHPCGSGDFAIEVPDVGVWTSYKIALSDLVANSGSSLNLNRVDSPLVIFPAWGNQQGVVMQIDNLRLTKGEGTGSDEGDDSGTGEGGGSDNGADNELIVNGTFDNGIEGWNTGVVGNEGDNYFFQANIASAGNPWDVNLSQTMTLMADTTYVLTFNAKASITRNMIVGLGLYHSPWTNVSETVALTNEWQSYTYTLTTTGFGDDNSRVLFDLGADVGSVYIDDVSVTILSSSDSDNSGGTDDGSDPNAPEPSENWTLVWSDEFDSNSIDSNKWDFEQNCWGGGNQEQQCYTNRSDNAFIESGILNIVAKREDFTGPANVDGSGSSTLPYTSARLRTMHKADWLYGRFEIRAKLPEGQGTWPAIWMLPTDYVYGGWAASGEIDIMEAVNLKVANSNGAAEARVHGSLHYGKAWPENKHATAQYNLPNGVNPADSFHTYALEWQEDEIRWYVDGVHYATQRDTGWYSQYMENGELVTATTGAPFNQHFHMLLNLAVGGTWAGSTHDGGINEAIFPQTLAVDYVRVYECSIRPSTGTGCATIGEDALIVDGHTPPPVSADANFATGDEFTLYGDTLTTGLEFNRYDPDSNISYQEVAEAQRGNVLQVNKVGNTGNLYFEYPLHADLSAWQSNGQLVFDVKIDSKEDTAQLIVKMDSGWPNTSDYTVTVAELGQWAEVTIGLADLIANGNRFSVGNKANIDDVANLFVIEPTGIMSVAFDNIRLVQAEEDNDSSPGSGDTDPGDGDTEPGDGDVFESDSFMLISSTGDSDVNFTDSTISEWSTGSQIVSNVTYDGLQSWEITSAYTTAEQGNWGTVLAFQNGVSGNFDLFNRIDLKVATTGGYDSYKLFISANGVSKEITLAINDSLTTWQNVSLDAIDIPLNLSSVDTIAIYGKGGTPGASKIYIAELSIIKDQAVIFSDSPSDDFVFISSDPSVTTSLIVDNDNNSDAGNVIFGEWSTGTTISSANHQELGGLELSAGGSWGAVLALQGDISDGVNVDNYDVDFNDYTNLKFKVASEGAFARYAVAIVAKVEGNQVSQEVEFSVTDPNAWNDVDINLAMYGINLAQVNQMAIFGVYEGGSAAQKIYITDLIIYDSGKVAKVKDSSDDKFVFFSSTGEATDMIFDGDDFAHNGNTTINDWSTGTQFNSAVNYQGLSAFELTRGSGSWGAVLALMGDIYGDVQEYKLDGAKYSTVNLKVAAVGAFTGYKVAFITDEAEFKLALAVDNNWTDITIDIADLPVNLSKITQIAIYGEGGNAEDKIYITDLNISK